MKRSRFALIHDHHAAIAPVFHRVVMPTEAVAAGETRISMPFFQRPPRDAIIAPPQSSTSSAVHGSSGKATPNGMNSGGGSLAASVIARDPVGGGGGGKGLGMAEFFQQVLKHRAYNRNRLDGFIESLVY